MYFILAAFILMSAVALLALAQKKEDLPLKPAARMLNSAKLVRQLARIKRARARTTAHHS